MIGVRMDLDSALSPSRDRHLGSIDIVNDGQPATPRLHNYDVTVRGTRGQVIRRGRIERWDRDGKSPMQLLTAALASAGYKADTRQQEAT